MQPYLNDETDLEDYCPEITPLYPITKDHADEVARMLSALADPIRLQLISMISRAKDQRVCACSLVSQLNRSQPTVSHHLKTLTALGICKSERIGRWIWYSINPESLNLIVSSMELIFGTAHVGVETTQ